MQPNMITYEAAKRRYEILSPAMAKDIEILGIRLCVRPSITKLVSAITSDFMHRFTQYLTQ